MRDSEYQHGYSNISPAMYDGESRTQKAKKALAILEDHFKDLSSLTLLDIGCSAGFLTHLYSQRFKAVTGVDIDEPAVRHAAIHNAAPNLQYRVRDAMDTGLPDASFDVVTCTHIYEHVSDSSRLMAEIYRVLRPGGGCLFSAANRLTWMEPHYKLPLLSVIPKAAGHLYLRLARRGNRYFENHLTLWGLRRLVSRFEIVDFTLKVIQEPEKFCAIDVVTTGSVKQKLAVAALRTAYWTCPTYLWILKKPPR